MAGKPPDDLPAPQKDALASALEVIKTVMGHEEVRFSNLNSRAISLLSATSLVTALAGWFGKDALSRELQDIRIWVACTLGVALAGLLATALLLVFRVLMPKPRAFFESEDILCKPETLANGPQVEAIAFRQFRMITVSLRERNKSKVTWLHRAYFCFFVSVAAIVLGTGAVAAYALWSQTVA